MPATREPRLDMEHMDNHCTRILVNLMSKLDDLRTLEDLPELLQRELCPHVGMDWATLGIEGKIPVMSEETSTIISFNDGFCDNWWHLWWAQFSDSDFILHELVRHPIGTVIGMLDSMDWQVDEYVYAADVFTSVNWAKNGLMAMLYNDEKLWVLLGMYTGSFKRISQENASIFSAAIPILQNFVRRMLSFERFSYTQTGAEDFLALEDRPFLLFDENLNLLHQSSDMNSFLKYWYHGENMKPLPHSLTEILRRYASQQRPLSLTPPMQWKHHRNRQNLNVELQALQGVGDTRLYLATFAPEVPAGDFTTLLEYNLTPREIDVLGGLYQEKTDGQIAQDLGVSQVRVRKIVQRLGDKLQAKGRVEVLAEALKLEQAERME